jgi:nucleotide-binding universal stress UspA family protein
LRELRRRVGKYRKILVAFDGSDGGENALLQAFRLASDEKCWITVTTAVPEYSGDVDLTAVGDIHNVLRRPGKALLAKAASLAKREGALIKTVLEEGETHVRLVELAEAENCGVIVMGRSGMSTVQRAFIGSVTARVIGHSRRDVLVVPPGARIGWKNILLATDGSKNSDDATRKAIDFAMAYGGRIGIISVVDVPEELYAEAPSLVEKLVGKARGYVDKVQFLASAAGVEAETHVREGASHSVIIRLAGDMPADLIVMGSHGRSGIKRLLMGSVTEKVIGHAACPVLVVKT